MKLIPLTKGFFAKIDDEDFERVNKFKWHVIKGSKNVWYARTWNGKDEKGKRIILPMHRLILNVNDSDILVDHEDMDGLNNQKYNIRTCTRSQNQMNKNVQGKASKYIGVHWCTQHKKWVAKVVVKKKVVYAKFHSDEIEAAKLRDIGAKIHHGEFAKLNFEV